MMKQVNIQFPLRMLALLFGLFLSVGAFAQIDVKGHVKDATGEPIIGATVRVDGTQTATVTDFDGNFVLKANQDANITVTYIGYQPQTVKAAPTVEVIQHKNEEKTGTEKNKKEKIETAQLATQLTIVFAKTNNWDPLVPRGKSFIHLLYRRLQPFLFLPC